MDAAVLWTRRTRPQGLGKPHSTRFPTAPTRITVATAEEERRTTRSTASHTEFLTLPFSKKKALARPTHLRSVGGSAGKQDSEPLATSRLRLPKPGRKLRRARASRVAAL